MNAPGLASYDYSFPERLIAQAPASPRDAAQLLVYDRATGRVFHDTFWNLASRLPRGTVLVMNETKVVPARLALTKPTGGRVRILCLGAERGLVRALADRPLAPGMPLALTARTRFVAIRRDGNAWLLRPSFPIARLVAILERHGTAPIPPYIKHSPLAGKKLRDEYQTVFAKRNGSVAAPTASLHFTKRLLATLRRNGIEIRFLTLHVGLGTFAPVTDEHLARGALHEERYEIPRATIAAVAKAKRAGRPVIAVGTTVVRALESSANARGTIVRPRGKTDLFIREGYRFRIASGIITNFHVPRSSLLMLVSTFAGRANVMHLYRTAIRRGYRLFSFGDGMLIT